MEGKSLMPGKRYLLRLRGRQVPVLFEGRALFECALLFRRLDIIAIRAEDAKICRLSARALSKHFDDCALVGRLKNCGCANRLAAIADPLRTCRCAADISEGKQ